MREKIIEILNEICPGNDFENETAIIDDGIIDSLDIVAVISELMEEFDVQLGVNDLTPENIVERGEGLSFPDSVVSYFKGMMGQPAWGFPQDLQRVVLKGQEPITCRPADLLEPEMDKIREQAKPYMEQEEDCLTYAMFPQVAPKFFETRKEMREAAKVREEEKQKIGVDFAAMSHPVKLF